MSKPFGYSYLIDLYDCKEGVCDNLELCYRFLEELVDRLGMHKTAPPVVFHGPKDNGVEIYPDKAGVSGWVPLIESGIQLHSVQPRNFISIDIYTCGQLDIRLVKDFILKTFGAQHLEDHMITRGGLWASYD